MRILFVDDEKRILDGLRRSLRHKRQEWKMDFISTPLDAVQQLDKIHFDVVVSDLMMPNITGQDLLLKVKEVLPNALRIVLSGSLEHKNRILEEGVAHAFMAKPFVARSLETALQNYFNTHSEKPQKT